MNERGSATLWVLGLCAAVLFLGGMSLDLWRGVATRRELSAMADGAATAAANGIDADALRAGTVTLDRARAATIARDVLARDARTASLDAVVIDVTPAAVAVVLADEVPLTLLGLFGARDTLEVRVRAVASPEPRG